MAISSRSMTATLLTATVGWPAVPPFINFSIRFAIQRRGPGNRREPPWRQIKGSERFSSERLKVQGREVPEIGSFFSSIRARFSVRRNLGPSK